MTGPGHYQKAEEFLAVAENADPDADHGAIALLLQFASVHATLALAAATALLPFCDPDSGREDFDLDAWRQAAGATSGQNDGPCACDHHGDHAGCGAGCECAR